MKYYEMPGVTVSRKKWNDLHHAMHELAVVHKNRFGDCNQANDVTAIQPVNRVAAKDVEAHAHQDASAQRSTLRASMFCRL